MRNIECGMERKMRKVDERHAEGVPGWQPVVERSETTGNE
jgi:hypothetical protein